MEILKEVELSTGKKLTIYKGKGKHLLNAQAKAQDAQQILWALFSELVEIDGKRVFIEDLLEMELIEVFQRQAAFSEAYGNFLSLPQRQLSSSQGTQAGESEKSKR